MKAEGLLLVRQLAGSLDVRSGRGAAAAPKGSDHVTYASCSDFSEYQPTRASIAAVLIAEYQKGIVVPFA